MKALKGIAILVLLMLAACAEPGARPAPSQPQQAAEVENALPQPPDQSADERQATQNARQAYIACLNRAARYADDHIRSSANLAGVVAPMCYAKFVEYEAAAEVGMSRHDTWLDIRHGDQQQTELAEQAVAQERSQAALSINK